MNQVVNSSIDKKIFPNEITQDVISHGSNPGSGRSPGEGNGHPLQYPHLENSVDRGACRAIIHGVTKS